MIFVNIKQGDIVIKVIKKSSYIGSERRILYRTKQDEIQLC